jgi:glutathione S-transferase
MSATPRLILHRYAASHPCRAVQAALKYKGLEYELDDIVPGTRLDELQEHYGPGNTTLPGMLIGDDAVHTSVAIMRRLEELAPSPTLYPAPRADAVRAAEEWGDGELQDLGRRLPWGVLRFRPQAMGTFGGGGELDPAGIDGALGFTYRAWRYHRISAARLADDIAGLPALLDHVDALAGEGVIGGDEPNAADLQIASTLRVLSTIGDLDAIFAGRPALALAHRWFPKWHGHTPAGSFPASVMGLAT